MTKIQIQTQITFWKHNNSITILLSEYNQKYLNFIHCLAFMHTQNNKLTAIATFKKNPFSFH